MYATILCFTSHPRHVVSFIIFIPSSPFHPTVYFLHVVNCGLPFTGGALNLVSTNTF